MRGKIVVLMIRVAHWHGPDIKTPSNENGSKVENGLYCPVNVETDHLT